MPKPIVEAVALPHRPERLVERSFSPLTAVHVASALEHETSGEPPVFVPAELNTGHLQELGLAEQLTDWREDCAPKLETVA